MTIDAWARAALEGGVAVLYNNVGISYEHAEQLQVPPAHQSYLTESVYNVIFQKSIPAQIRQSNLYMSKNRGNVDEFVWESTFAKRL